MKKKTLFLLTILTSITCFSQISFEKGYYINNSDQKIDCFIKNIDWLDNPTKFEYKITKDSDEKTIAIKSVKEFGIYNISKYIRNIVNIDRSSEVINKISNDKKPIFIEELLFLKMLVEGKSNLYQYIDGELIRYFYDKENTKVTQLIYKSYNTDENYIGKNNRFRQQLWSDLKCSTFTMNKMEYLDYKKNELVGYFVAYNKSINQEYINFEEKQKRDLFNLNFRPGFNLSNLSIENSISYSRNTDFDAKIGLRFGIEAELIMPFNKSKWSIIIEPTYQYFKTEKNIRATQNIKIDYSSIELPIGVRHYFYLNENSKFFINGSFILDFSPNSVINFQTDSDLEIKTGTNLAFGMGYKHNNKYSLEVRYLSNRNILNTYQYWFSDYKTVSIIFGYSIF